MPYEIKRVSDNVIADFITLDPENPNTASPVVETVNRPNVDGSGFRVLAKKGQPYRWIGFRNFKNIYSARDAIDTLRYGIKGQLIEVNNNTQFYTRLMCLEVRELLARSIVLGVNGLSISTGGLWDAPVGSSTVPAIGIVEIVVVHVGDAAP